MSAKAWGWLVISLLINFSEGWLDERPVLESINGNLYISSAKDKNITLKTLGSGNVNINDINLLQTVWAAQNASLLVERWKVGILDDVESTLQRLTHIVEGPNGLVRKLNAIEFPGDSTVNASTISRPTSSETDASANAVSPARVKALGSRLRRLENKVRAITTKLRTNNCASDPCQNGGTCINGYDTFQCHCPPEWEGSQCTVDVNECNQLAGRPGGCQNGATCVNLPGTFRCNCPTGWHGFHCSTQKSVCDQSNDAELCGNGICIKSSSPLGYTCLCKTGWDHLGDNDPSCRKDIDECTSNRYPCSVNPLVTCHNVPGTFYCGTCPAGYTGDGFKCQDIDECLVNNGGCSTTPFVECINTLGSRKCGACPSGYQGDGVSCYYTGSCNVNNGGCHSLASCREGPNSETICTCPAGYQGLGKGPQGCIPAENACRSNPCVHGSCNSHGLDGFSCTCTEGYTGTRCDVPINPCIPNPCQNNGICHTTPLGRRYCECTSSYSGPLCATARQSCGGFFRNPSGYVEFPVGAGNKYDHGLSCAWVLLTNQTMVLNVTFTRFSLETSHGEDECKHDYVQIHDGRSAGSHIFGRYCGNKLPNNGTIISTHNSLYIWFHSDSTVNREGFAFNWTSIEPVCGGVLNEEYGSISSPGYPGKYPTNRDCYWTINVMPGKRIALHFINLMLEEHPTCDFDYLEVNETNYAGEHQLGLFCNHTKPAPITTSGSHVTIHFHSDNSGTDDGFHLSFLSIAGSPDCGGIFTTESGEITSPGYHSGGYKPGLICEWEIRLPENSRVRINWLHFDVEQSRNCMFDAVEVFQGATTDSPLVGRYCGSRIPPTVSIKSNKVLIRFESDLSLEEGGFVVKYEVECGGTFTEPSGIITSPYYPNYYPALKDCIYLISQPPGKAIALTFEFMDIEEGTTVDNNTECYFDRIEIRDGDTENSTLLSSLCGSSHFMPQYPIISTHNYMFLEFFTDASIHNLGFKANYTTIDRECGGILKDGPGVIDMPGRGSGKTWGYKADCLWTIRAPPGHAIQISWIEYPTRQSYVTDECGANYLELVEDYGSADQKSLGKYCPLRPPPKLITTQGNDLTLHYKFSGDVVDIIYMATYVFINDSHSCGGHYYAETGTIRSPNYPERYPKNKECVWIIEAKNKYLISLTVSSFDIEDSLNCAYDYLEIRSGSQENSPLLGRFCGEAINQEIVSMTNQMYIKFVSDSSLQDPGFELDWHSTQTGCGGSLRTSSGSIMSPNYPQNYYHRAACTWDIRVAAGSAIQITFVDFDIEDHIQCGFDYLEISDVINGYVQNPRRFCGSTSPPNIVSNSNHIKITFRTDVLTNSRGFHLRYVTDCNNKLTGFQGVIESPNFPNSYNSLSNCSWTVSVPPGNTVNITFSHFDIRTDNDGACTKDYVTIQEGDNDEPNTQLMKKCGPEDEVLPLQISSTQRQVFVSFISNRGFVSSGFRLEWYVNGCSQHFTKPYGHFTSPGFPRGDKFPHSSVTCEWLIEVDSDHSIELTFPKLETTRSHSCSSDTYGSVEVYNGQDEKALLLAHELCYSNTPVTLTSSGNRMFIKYSQETVYASYGFEATYHTTEIKCGGKFTGQSGAIHSPNYPKNYPSNQQCEWLITVDKDHSVNLTFVDLDFEATKNCTNDYIKIYDGDSTEAPLVATHCHSIDAAIYYISTGNQLLVEMRTDESITSKGFKALYNRTCGATISVDGQGILRSSPTLHTLDSSNCSWTLMAKDPGDKVTLAFTHLDIDIQDCSENYLAIYDGEGTDGPLLGLLCDNKIPTPFYSTGNALTVHLVSSYGPSLGDTFDATYSTFSTACGGTYTAESGTIATPNYPLSYPSKADCIWILQNAPGNRLSLSFEDFELIDSANCDVDYLEIRENDGVGKLRGVFCGKNIESITSSQPIWMRFKSASNSIGNPKGFKAEYNYLFGDEIAGDFGEIASPMYPLRYRKSSTFTWRITVDFNYAIKLDILELSLDNYDEYCYTSLKIYDGYNDEAPQLKELCGIQVPDEPITSTSNVVYIEFDSTVDPVGNLFRLKWIKVPKTAISDETEVFRDSQHEVIILTHNNGTYSFRSPGFPDGYENNLKHSWTFISPVGSHLLLRFLTLDVEESMECVTDYVAIYNGHITTFDSSEKPLNKVCLSNATLANYPGTNVMTVQFVTDVSQNKTGFSAVVITECGGTIEKSMGVIEVNNSLEFARPRPYIYNCEWVVKVRPGRRIAVKVIANKIDNSQKKTDDNSCRSNYLMLKNGESSSSPLLGTGKYCNGVIPSVQNTSSNYLYVKLAVSFAWVDFKLQFKELGHDCGGRFTLNKKSDLQQEITSPNYPNIPSPHIECIWTFMSAEENRLSIHFLDRFDLAFSEDCEKEYVEIRDGGTDMSTLIGRFCKNTAPSSLSTKGNLMYVRYYTDLPEPRNGFKALVTTGDVCGGIERESRGGIISSPNWPETYGFKSHHCSWWIMAPTANRAIRLQFQDLDLPIRRNCSSTDHIEVYEKLPGSFNNTKVGTYCGKTKPGIIDVVTSEALVVFESSFTNSRLPSTRGFRLNYTFNSDGCGGTFSGMRGVFQTNGYPRPYSSYKYCHWKIAVPIGFQVKVDILDLDIGGDKYSTSSHASFHHDPDSIAMIATLRDNDKQSMSISSSSRYMSIYYISTGGHRGMKARYTAIAPAPCGRESNSWEDTFSSPDFAPYNESSFFCEWTIIKPPEMADKKVDLTLSMTISGIINKGKASTSCRNYLSYIMIKGEEPVAKICGNLTSDVITVSSPFKIHTIEAINATNSAKVNFTINYKWHKCGGILTGPSHILRAPKNISYPVHCSWKVRYPNYDDTVLLTFEKMNLRSCDKSFIQIKGRTYRSPILGQFCGNVKPQNIVSPSSELMIEYYATEEGNDFELHLDPANYACGGMLKGKRTEIRSPGFPNSYTNNTECVWEIVANAGYHIGLTFVERFNIETSKDCQNDYVELYEWKEELQNNTDHWKTLGRVCGRIPPPPFNTTTNRMLVKFVSNEKIEGEGFKAVWNSNCGGVYDVTETIKYIESPNYLSMYPANSYCNYTLIAPEEQDIVVDFTYFSIEGNSAACTFDNVTIMFYQGEWLRGQNSWCGNNSPGRKLAKGRMEIIFRSDSSVSRAGFKFKYSLNDCGGVITSPRMINPIMEHDADSFGYMRCQWTVVAPLKKSVLLRFEEFNISQPFDSCIANSVQVYEGNSTDESNRKAKFCGDLGSKLPVVQSYGNVMTITFDEGSYERRETKLKAAILFVNGPEQGCGGNLNVTRERHFQTQPTEYYEPLQDCHWLINSPPGTNIQFTINEIDIKNTTFNDTVVNKHMSCNSDYLEVRDGGPYAELIGHYCGNTVPPPISTTANLIWIRFVSDGVNEGRGVKATVKAVTSPCGVTDLYVGNDTQVLTSPSYPNANPSDITCRWVIRESEPYRHTRVKIKFRDFNLEDSEKCGTEYLQISDMDSREIISEGFGEQFIVGGSKNRYHNIKIASRVPLSFYKYCGEVIPHDYFSNYKNVEITYKATGGRNRKGFRLEYGKASCTRRYTSPQGRIINDDITDCHITIEVPQNSTISMYFNHFFLPGTADCSKSAMEIRDGGPEGKIVQSVCNFETPNPVFSTGNVISIHAFAAKEGIYHSNAYDITYTSTTAGRGCGGQLYNYGGTFTSPFYPNPYRNRSVCVWEVSVPRGMKVSLQFANFDIGPKNMCDSDYLTISEAQSIGNDDSVTYCGGDTPADYKSKNDRVLVTYSTSVNNGGSGWVAHFAAL